MERTGRQQGGAGARGVERMDIGLVAVLLAGFVGVAQVQLLLTDTERPLASEAPQVLPEPMTHLDALPPFPKAGIPVFDFETRTEPVPDPLEWEPDRLPVFSVEHMVVEDSSARLPLKEARRR